MSTSDEKAGDSSNKNGKSQLNALKIERVRLENYKFCVNEVIGEFVDLVYENNGKLLGGEGVD